MKHRLQCAASLAALVCIASVASVARAQDHYAASDAYADAAPPSAERSVATLSAYLARVGPDDLARTRTLYRWVTGHISYDARGFRTGNVGDLTPEAVLRRREAVCDGYSHLLQALGVAMGLQVEVVTGWSKGYGYTTGQRLQGRSNHSWNAVRVDGRWRLLDPTWGSGVLDERLNFVRHFEDHYFLTPPDAFAYDHFPDDARWQLLDHQISLDEFADMVYLRPMFFQAGFKIISHSHAKIQAEDRVTVTLGVTQAVEIAAELVDPRTNQKTRGENAFAQVDNSHAEIAAAFPQAGDYIIRVFAKTRGSTGPLGWVLDYRVNASRGTRDATFPTAYSGFATSGAWLLSTMNGNLDAGHSYLFHLKAPGATEVMLDNGGRRTVLKRKGDDFSAEVSAVNGEAVLYASYGLGGSYVGLLRYLGH